MARGKQQGCSRQLPGCFSFKKGTDARCPHMKAFPDTIAVHSLNMNIPHLRLGVQGMGSCLTSILLIPSPMCCSEAFKHLAGTPSLLTSQGSQTVCQEKDSELDKH